MTGPDGVTQLYPTKPGGEEWYLSPVPSADARFKPQGQITPNPDGSWKMKSAKVRMEVLTSTGYRALDTTDRKILADRGYMLAPNDWRNVEMTGFVKLNRASKPTDNFCWYARGGRHTSSAPCEGSSIKGGLHYDGRVRVEKESWHVSYTQWPFQKGTTPLAGRWVGFKVVIYNAGSAARCDLWISDGAPDQWRPIWAAHDDGTFGGDAIKCGAADPRLPITWGGPIACFRWDNAEDVDFKLLSVREIATEADPQPQPVPTPQPQPGGTVTVPKIDHLEQVAPDRIVKTTLGGRDCYAFTVRPGDVQEWDKGNIGPGGQPNERAEISYAPAASGEKHNSPYNVTSKTGRQVYSIGLNFADGWPPDQRWATLFQFHQDDTLGGSPEAQGFGGLTVHGNDIDVGVPFVDGPKIAAIPITPGKWYDVVLDVNWSVGDDGYVRVSVNGQPVGTDYHGPTIRAGTFRYLKQGYYRDGAIAQPGTVYQTQVSISDGGAAPVVTPPTPEPSPPSQPPIGLNPKAAAGLALLVDEGPRMDALIAALEQAKAVVAQLRAEVRALLDKGPWT